MTIFSNSANRLLALSILTFLFLASPARSQETVDLFDPADPVIGYNLVSYQDNNPRELEEYFKAIDELIAVNADHVNLVVFRRVGADGAFDYTSGPSIMTIYLAALRAKTNNLKVTITPIFETETENAWRGAWNPTGEALSNFNRDYLRFVRWLAVISRWSDADKLNVGSELSAFVNNPDNKFAMQRLLAVCSRIYSGELGYNANWDNVESPAVKEIFWDDRRINTLSVSMYPYMRLASFREADRSNRDPVAFAQQVKSRWEEIIMGELLPYAQTLKNNRGMPVAIGEFGAVPFNRCAATPADFQPSDRQDVREQEAVIMGLIRAVDQLGPGLPEITIWQWGIGDMSDQFGLNPFHESPQQATALEILRFMETAGSPDVEVAPMEQTGFIFP